MEVNVGLTIEVYEGYKLHVHAKSWQSP